MQRRNKRSKEKERKARMLGCDTLFMSDALRIGKGELYLGEVLFA